MTIITSLTNPETETPGAPVLPPVVQRYAQVVNGIVQCTVVQTTNPDGTNGAWVACPDFVGDGCAFDGSAWTPPSQPG